MNLTVFDIYYTLKVSNEVNTHSFHKEYRSTMHRSTSKGENKHDKSISKIKVLCTLYDLPVGTAYKSHVCFCIM